MDQLAKLEDLPQEYRDNLEKLNLVPLWPSLRDVLPPESPQPKTKPVFWSYEALRPLLLQAGELTPIEKAERRVLVLANPGHGLENMRASSVMYLGMQLLLPGEWAPSHRHTPNAVRMIVEGNDAYTTVDGQKCPMERGDLILTPTGMWHEHTHEGTDPVVWLDVLDLPLVYFMEASYVQPGEHQNIKGSSDETDYGPGIVPTPVFERRNSHYPMLRYAWKDARKALESMAKNQPEAKSIQITYVNPENGDDCQKIIGYSALMLRPNETLTLPLRSSAMVFHIIEGHAQVQTTNNNFDMKQSDTSCVPCFAPVTFVNNNADQPTFIFIADESPVQKKLGLYSEHPNNQ